MQDKTVTTSSNYPSKPITIIVPFSAGGGSDMIARTLEKKAPQYLGQPLVVLNKPGGGGTIGWNELASAQHDGYTIGITNTNLILQPLYGPTKYNYPTALEPLAQIVNSPVLTVVQADQPWQTISDIIAYAKQNPGQVKFGHGGIGTVAHITGEMFGNEANISIKQVPFRGSSEGLTALLGGHIQLLFANPAVVKEHVKNGKLRVLAVAESQRLNDTVFKNVPTFKEQGLNITITLWQGIAAPKGLPKDIKLKLFEGLKKIILDTEFKENIKNLCLEIHYLGPKEAEEQWIHDTAEYSKMIKETGILDMIKAQKK